MALSPEAKAPPPEGSAAARWAARAILIAAGVALPIGLGLLILFGFTGAGPGFVVLGLILLVIFGFLEPESLRAFMGQGELQAGTKAIGQALLVVGAVILVNIVVKDRLASAKLDLSKGQSNTLAPQTQDVLKSLNGPVTATVWYQSSASEMDTSFNLLKKYHDVNSNFVVQRFSILDQPQLVAQQKAQADSVVFQYKNRAPQLTTGTTEQDFTTSLLRLSTGKSPKAYFLTGHGEGDVTTASQTGTSYTALKQQLDAQGITTAVLNLASGSTAAPAPTDTSTPVPGATPSPPLVQALAVPKDADEVVILDPRSAFSTSELASLDAYLKGGGHVLASSAPLAKNNLNDLLSKYGITFDTGVVLDSQLLLNNSTSATVLEIQHFGQSPVTRGLDTLPVVLIAAAPVNGKAPANYTFTPLISTEGTACERTDLTITDPNCQSADKQGPFSLAGAMDQTGAASGAVPTRIVAFGGGSFASDLVASQAQPPPGNLQLMINAVNWLAGRDKLINIAPRTGAPGAVFLSNAQRQLVFIGYPFFVPALISALGIGVWYRRRQ